MGSCGWPHDACWLAGVKYQREYFSPHAEGYQECETGILVRAGAASVIFGLAQTQRNRMLSLVEDIP